MSWTKRQVIAQAFRKAGLAVFIHALRADQWQSAANDLDAMILAWQHKGVTLGYTMGSDPDTLDIDVDSGLPLECLEAVFSNLAIKLCSDFGKTPSVELKTAARSGLDALFLDAAQPKPMPQDGRFPSGAGNKNREQPFVEASDLSPIQVGDNGQLNFGA